MTLFALAAILILTLTGPAHANIGDCGQPRSGGDHATVADALHILGAALRGGDCPAVTCDVDDDCRVTPRDALHTFRHAIGLDDALSCSAECPDETQRCGESEAPTCGGECPQGYECRPHDRELPVPVCHIPPGNPDNEHTIFIDPSAVRAHLAHGDYLGRCRDCEKDHRDPKRKHDRDNKRKKDRHHKHDKDRGHRCDPARGDDNDSGDALSSREVECRCDVLEEPSTTTSTSSTSTSTSITSTTITLPSGDEDNDGIADANGDPCLNDARNLCAGTVAVDGATGNDIRLNAGVTGAACGGVKVDCAGATWNADFGYNQADSATGCTTEGGCPIAGVTDLFGCTDEATQDLFRCEHWDPAPLPDLGYSFEVPDGSYVVNLFFANTFLQTATVGARVMDLIIEDETVYAGFDPIAAAAGATQTAVVRSAVVTVDDGNGLQIFFDHVVENPSVKAIEVLAVTAP